MIKITGEKLRKWGIKLPEHSNFTDLSSLSTPLVSKEE